MDREPSGAGKEPEEVKEQKSEAAKREPPMSILVAAQTFILDAEALVEILEVSKPVLVAKQQERSQELATLVSSASAAGAQPDFRQIHQVLGLLAKLTRGGFLFRGHLLVALVSRFDSFIADVIRELLFAFPDRLGKRSISYSEAAKYSSIDELKASIIEDEVDKVMRQSHQEQLEFLSSLANVTLGSDEPALLNRFVELTERRNCHVHFGGKVSPQYRRVCVERGIKIHASEKGRSNLNVTVNYIRSARWVLSEIAFKIAQTIVRKTFTDWTSFAEIHLNVMGLQFLNEHRWSEALMVFDYAANLRGSWAGAESDKRNNIINKAQALIGLGRVADAMKVVGSIDWSASHPKYTMAIHLLKKQFDQAATLMPVAGFSEEDYGTLPIFESFRQTEQFMRGFVAHFHRDFNKAALGAVTQKLEEMKSNPAAATGLETIRPQDGLMKDANLDAGVTGK